MSELPQEVKIDGRWAVLMKQGHDRSAYLCRRRGKFSLWAPHCDCPYCKRNASGAGVYHRSREGAEECLAVYLLQGEEAR